MAYEGFAQVYDEFMIDVPYDKWCEYIIEIFKKHNLKINTNLIAELGCGTGNMTERLAKKGFEMIGIDLSESMLAKAIEKAIESELDILYLNQDMAEFELYGTVDAIISICDSINYITEKAELLKVFKLVNNYLEPNGLFVFDINTIYKFENVLGCNSFCQTTENSAYTWENYYDEEERINEYYLNFFVKNGGGTYDRTQEEHYERAYSLEEIKGFIEKSGMRFEAAYDAFTFEPAREDSERICVIAREIMKKER